MNQQGQDTTNDSLIIAVVALVAFIGLYWFFAPKAQEWFLTVKMWQMAIISTLAPTETNLSLYHMLQTTPSSDWTSDQVRYLSRRVNLYIAPFFFAFVAYIYLHLKRNLYLIEKNRGKAYTINTLMRQEVTNVFRFLKPIMDENLLENRSAEWARAMKPQEFAIHNDLLDIPNDLASLNEEKTKKILALQLGNLYTGIEQMPDYIKALVGCFAEHYFESSLRARMAFMDMSDSYAADANGKYDYSAGLKLFEKHKHNEKLHEMANIHAYIYTFIADVFDTAKERGICITKYFLWLKKTDRRLYYMLNRMGRQVSWIECAGITDHYQHEKQMNRPLAKIFCNAAFLGLKEELRNVKLTERSQGLIAHNREVHQKINENVYGT